MKINKLLPAAFIAFAMLATPAFADEEESNKDDNLSFYTTVDFAYYPASAHANTVSNHFSMINGAYSGLEGRVEGGLNYVIPTPLGDNWLVNSANVTLNGALELTPISVKSAAKVSFTPVPFLVFSAGIQEGTGWEIPGLMQGMAAYNGTDYANLTAFKNNFVKWWAQGTFQFDTGALIPGDWTHIVMMYSYQVYYEGMTGVADGQLWSWQGSKDKVNGLCEYMCGILAYQMPIPLYRVGVMVESNGHYSASDYGVYGDSYNGSFKTISISPLAQINIGSHDQLTTLLGFSSRRAYSDYDKTKTEATLTYVSREWFFNRVALSWTHNF